MKQNYKFPAIKKAKHSINVRPLFYSQLIQTFGSDQMLQEFLRNHIHSRDQFERVINFELSLSIHRIVKIYEVLFVKDYLSCYDKVN